MDPNQPSYSSAVNSGVGDTTTNTAAAPPSATATVAAAAAAPITTAPVTNSIANNKSIELKKKIREIEYVYFINSNPPLGKRFIAAKVGPF